MSVLRSQRGSFFVGVMGDMGPHDEAATKRVHKSAHIVLR